ncbi:hypothetical protein ON010_g3218 [Phytophthora cinnamomi]|nr:hypothetical protein ON010_g3218 [Phytophthora cinnamomi]
MSVSCRRLRQLCARGRRIGREAEGDGAKSRAVRAEVLAHHGAASQRLLQVLRQQDAAVVVVLLRVLDEAPAVDVAHVRGVAHPEDVEAADGLLEGAADPVRDLLLLGGQHDRVPDLLAVGIAHHAAVQHGGLARLRVRVVRADRVHLDVGALRGQELLVDVRALAVAGAHLVDLRVVLAGAVADLAEEAFAAAAGAHGVVDVDVVVLAVHGLLHERLVDAHAVHLDEVVALHDLGRLRAAAVAVAAHDHVARRGHVVLLQHAVDLAPSHPGRHRRRGRPRPSDGRLSGRATAAATAAADSDSEPGGRRAARVHGGQGHRQRAVARRRQLGARERPRGRRLLRGRERRHLRAAARLVPGQRGPAAQSAETELQARLQGLARQDAAGPVRESAEDQEGDLAQSAGDAVPAAGPGQIARGVPGARIRLPRESHRAAPRAVVIAEPFQRQSSAATGNHVQVCIFMLSAHEGGCSETRHAGEFTAAGG